MKKILLSLMLTGAFLFGRSQVVLNEVYTEPNLPGHQEFFELYSSAVGGATSLDCYQLITYFKTGTGQNVEIGFYVLDFPAASSINYQQYFVGAATSPFSVQTSAANAAFNTNVIPNLVWTTAGLSDGGSLKKYVWNGGAGYTMTDAAGLSDFFTVNTGTNPSTGVFLFDNGSFINGFMAGVNSTSIPQDITNLPDLPITVNCGGVDFPKIIDLDGILKAEFVGSNAGTDNGFARTSDGKCGSWVKTSSSVNHTPKRTNGSAAGLAGSLTTQQLFVCPTSPDQPGAIRVNVTGATGDATADNSLPVEVRLYYDFADDVNNDIGTLDDNDVYKLSVNYATFTDGQKSFVIPYADKNQPIIIVYKTALGCFDKVVSLEPSCIALPVQFKSFNATRTTSSNVAITWTTAMEQNSKGFNVQKNVGGEWKTIAFVFSQAEGGNSSSDLSYSFKDVNNEKGITQYRIQQVDLDGMAKYSDIKAIRGESTTSKIVVYPNPSVDGKLNVVFEDKSGVRDIQVADMQGRIVKSYQGITNNILVIERLTSGFYTIKVTNRNTAATSVEKVVVK